jgi:ArsR family transcriptional regulator
MADENRLKIIDMLSCGEICACKILENLAITQATLSYHMKFLCDSALVQGRKEGKWMHYSLNNAKIKEFKEFLDKITENKTDCVCFSLKSKEKCV